MGLFLTPIALPVSSHALVHSIVVNLSQYSEKNFHISENVSLGEAGQIVVPAKVRTRIFDNMGENFCKG